MGWPDFVFAFHDGEEIGPRMLARIADHPQSFQRRDDLAQAVRQAIHGRYFVLFTIEKDGLVVERVLHGARRLEDLI